MVSRLKPCFERVHDCTKLLNLTQNGSIITQVLRLVCVRIAHCSVLVSIVSDVSQMEGSDSTNYTCRVKAADE